MSFNKSLWSSAHGDWATPKELYEELHGEFQFTLDPCPMGGSGGLDIPWIGRVYVNPPYGREIGKWVRKGYEDSNYHKSTVVMLLPSRTDIRWWHDYCMKADEIRFIKGRLRFGGAKNSAPFPSAIVIFKPIP